MKKRFLIVALIGLILVVGMVLIGCEQASTGKNDSGPCPQGGECRAGSSNTGYSASGCGKSSCSVTTAISESTANSQIAASCNCR